ncbi:MAG: helix-turn-helix domain-containing protein [Anaerolineales bacterium]|jgi:excisionase family DNA binding protein
MDVEKIELILHEKLLKASEVAEIPNISRSLAYQLMNRGDIRTVNIGTARRVRPKDLEAYIIDSINPPLPIEMK